MSLTSIESARFELRSGFTSAINGIAKTAFFCVAMLVLSTWSHWAAAATINYPDPSDGEHGILRRYQRNFFDRSGAIVWSTVCLRRFD